jgi:glyoxylase-like metal-dependent hydrolase (beta-lactamase superfamily II)
MAILNNSEALAASQFVSESSVVEDRRLQLFRGNFLPSNVLNNILRLTAEAGIVFCVMARQVETVVVGSFLVNCYIVWDDQTSEAVIIDPGDEAPLIIDRVKRTQVIPKAILLTHGHVDHIAAVGDVKEEYQVPLYVGKGEEQMLADPGRNGSAFLSDPVVAPQADRLVADEQELVIGGLAFRVLATPGHTAAGVCYLDETEGLLFCGDTLFRGSIGRTDLPGGSLNQLLESIRTKIMRLPDDIICFPGHGPTTTVGAERTGNPFLIGGAFA